MIIFALCYSLFFIGIGFLTGRYPTLISGISTMSAQKRKNVDLRAMGRLYQRGLIATGISAGAMFVIFSLLELEAIAMVALIAITFIGAIAMSILGSKYNRNPTSKRSIIVTTAVMAIVMVIVGNAIYSSAQPTEVIVTDTEITFTGKYGTQVELNQIKTVELLQEIPRIKMRVNGSGLGNILKGEFNLEEIGRCRLFVTLPNPPFLYLELESGKKIIFNSKEPGYTDSIYYEICNK